MKLLVVLPDLNAKWLLDSLLSQAGIDYEKITITYLTNGNDIGRASCADVERGIAKCKVLVQRLRPHLIVTCGNAAAYALVPKWPSSSGDYRGSYGIEQRRGYLWTGYASAKILTTLTPAACTVRQDPSGINEMLLLKDLERARNESKTSALKRSIHKVSIVNASNSNRIFDYLSKFDVLACDIECHLGPQFISCIGFAPNAHEAYVFTPRTAKVAHKLLLDKSIAKIFANAQFDLYQLLSRAQVRTAGEIHDVFIQWHTVWPEIASQREGKKSSKRTYKSLAFLESIYGDSPEWWKDYEFADDAEMYELNGKDCCKTYAIWEKMNVEIDAAGVRKIYEHERKLLWPVVEIQHRGLRVDAAARSAAIAELEQSSAALSEEITHLIESLLQERRDQVQRPQLFWKTKSCRCCGGGKKKSQQCWSCAGFDAAPSKAQLIENFVYNKETKLTKTFLEEAILQPCEVCKGEGSWETFNYNPSSNDQTKEILYNVLKLPTRTKRGELSSDEEALKSLLGGLG